MVQYELNKAIELAVNQAQLYNQKVFNSFQWTMSTPVDAQLVQAEAIYSKVCEIAHRNNTNRHLDSQQTELNCY